MERNANSSVAGVLYYVCYSSSYKPDANHTIPDELNNV